MPKSRKSYKKQKKRSSSTKHKARFRKKSKKSRTRKNKRISHRRIGGGGITYSEPADEAVAMKYAAEVEAEEARLAAEADEMGVTSVEPIARILAGHDRAYAEATRDRMHTETTQGRQSMMKEYYERKPLLEAKVNAKLAELAQKRDKEAKKSEIVETGVKPASKQRQWKLGLRWPTLPNPKQTK